ncbi:MAG: hypothetical protein QXJ56_04275 [Ignisphaera sp.]|uniref:Uncharacterized protein n=1 Tax=Ignisphaera aggregans TaxID=334771 RepID=A0A7J3JQS1_9CREN
MATKNLPEAEVATTDVLIVVDTSIYSIYCDVDEILSCEEERCAKELYSNCIEALIEGTNIEVKHIGYVRGGKIVVYKVDGKPVCLCVCRRGVDTISLCNLYVQTEHA